MPTDDNEQSPFHRPSFLVAGVVVALIVVLGIVIGVVNATGDDRPSDETSSPSDDPTTSSPTGAPTPTDDAVARCSLGGEVLSGTLSTAPAAQWEFQGTTPYPTSVEYGPQPSDQVPEGVRACFQRSPAGAVFAAANAVAQGTGTPASVRRWIEYFVAAGPHRDTMLAQKDGSTDADGVRAELAGFRLLAYDGEMARVDIGVSGAADGQTVYLSMVYALVWEDGDWKLNVTNPDAPVDIAVVPELAGYIPWGP